MCVCAYKCVCYWLKETEKKREHYISKAKSEMKAWTNTKRVTEERQKDDRRNSAAFREECV